jgi:hypothetical protein
MWRWASYIVWAVREWLFFLIVAAHTVAFREDICSLKEPEDASRRPGKRQLSFVCTFVLSALVTYGSKLSSCSVAKHSKNCGHKILTGNFGFLTYYGQCHFPGNSKTGCHRERLDSIPGYSMCHRQSNTSAGFLFFWGGGTSVLSCHCHSTNAPWSCYIILAIDYDV